jgi:hypothetical protein
MATDQAFFDSILQWNLMLDFPHVNVVEKCSLHGTDYNITHNMSAPMFFRKMKIWNTDCG